MEPFCSIHYCIAENMKRISPEQETCDKFKLFKKGGEGE
jgi:hypothetical protein